MLTNYTGISGSRTAYVIASLTGGVRSGGAKDANKFNPNKKPVLIVVSSGRTAERLERDLSFCAPDSEIIVMQEEDDIQVLYEARNRESQIKRIKALQALISGTGFLCSMPCYWFCGIFLWSETASTISCFRFIYT